MNMKEVNFTCMSCREAICAPKENVGDLIECPCCGISMKVPVYGVIPGMKLGDFTIQKCLGIGGMGEVWLANQEALHRKVAVKILSPEIANDKNFVKRFLQEAKIAGKLTHPNIVMAYHAGEQDGILYIAISYIDGKPLGEMVENGAFLTQIEALRITREIAKALKYAWEKFNILHRDIKPDNIMLCHDGTPMLMDMGISKITNDVDESLTLTGTIVGTPYYISPEQARAENDLDFRSDQYSLGATLFHLLTGRLPFHATSAMGILAQHLQDPVPDSRELNSEISDECNDLIQKMMEKSPDNRFPSWNELINTIDQMLPPEMRDSTPLPGTIPAVPAKKSKAPGYIIVALVLILILVVVSLKKQLKQTKSENKDLKDLQELMDDSTKELLPEIEKLSDVPETEIKEDKVKTPPAKIETPGRKNDFRKPRNEVKTTDKTPAYDKDEKVKNQLKKKFNLKNDDLEKLTNIVKHYKQELKKLFEKGQEKRPAGRIRKMGEVRKLQEKASEKAKSILKTPEKIKEFREFLRQETIKFHRKHRDRFQGRK